MKTDTKFPTRWLAACLVSVAALDPAQALTPTEASGVLYMKQEEKLARDVYQALAVRWDHVTFRNIAIAEQRHMDAIDGLIARYGLTDPTPAEPGRFSIPELQKLHDGFVAQGGVSLADALRVGVLIEQTDIDDLEEALAGVAEPMIRRVFVNLLRASGQHRRAFGTAAGTVDENGDVTPGGTTCPGGGTCLGPNGGRGRAQGMGCGMNGRRNGAPCVDGARADCPKDGICPNPECPVDGPATDGTRSSGPGTPRRAGRR